MQLCANETVRLLSLNQNEIGQFGLFDLWFDVSPVHVFKEPKRGEKNFGRKLCRAENLL